MRRQKEPAHAGLYKGGGGGRGGERAVGRRSRGVEKNCAVRSMAGSCRAASRGDPFASWAFELQLGILITWWWVVGGGGDGGGGGGGGTAPLR